MFSRRLRVPLCLLALNWIAGPTAPAFAAPKVTGELLNTSEVIPFLSVWTPAARIPLKFDAHHTQGLVKIRDRFYLSSVEVLDKKKKTGVGHLFEFDGQGNLLRQITLGDAALCHPGGMDFDGTWIWVPVAEYRPKSRAIVYKVDPKTLLAAEAFRVEDHIGAVVFNRELKTVVGLSWDGDDFYEWTPEGRMLRKEKNDFNDVAYQDCKFVPGPAMLCGGVVGNAQGRLDLIDLLDFSRITGLWSIPRTQGRTLMTRNPMTVEQAQDKILYYFVPEDNFGAVYIYELQ